MDHTIETKYSNNCLSSVNEKKKGNLLPWKCEECEKIDNPLKLGRRSKVVVYVYCIGDLTEGYHVCAMPQVQGIMAYGPLAHLPLPLPPSPPPKILYTLQCLLRLSLHTQFFISFCYRCNVSVSRVFVCQVWVACHTEIKTRVTSYDSSLKWRGEISQQLVLYI